MAQGNIDALAAKLLHHYGLKLLPGQSVVPEIVSSAVFHLPGDPANASHVYGRYHNPTWEALEGALGVLEGAETLVFPSGMAAIGAVFFATARAGDRILLPADGYFAVRALAERFLVPLGVTVDTRPTAKFLDGGFAGYRLVHIETPSNPGLDVCDLRAAAAQAKSAGAILSVDNTTMTALGQRPLEHGADVAVCSDTKAVSGHSDTLMGHVATRRADLMERFKEWRKFSGTIAGPFEAWLVYRGLETLEVRFARMCETARVVAQLLAAHPKVKAVRYPGLASDPAHAIAARQMLTFGSMISFTLADGPAAERFIDGCPLVQPSTSFGGVRTCAERRIRWGDSVPEGFVRLSIGLEPTDTLCRAIESSLEKL
ncbi:MAG: cystathionine gamma-lyase [Alphaproteobacteria bacterium]|nr:cystathionine gamma-lyase [Alphaproteobacteria bacterium]